MGIVRLQKGTEEFEMFRDYWRMLEENWGIEETEEYWDKVIADTDAFYKKYKTAFSKDLAVALINELERRTKNAEKMHGDHSKK